MGRDRVISITNDVMKKLLRIEDEKALEKFIHDVDELHDALLHEAVILNPGYVNEGGEMLGDVQLPGAKLIFQSQSLDIQAVRINLKRVSKFLFEPKREFCLAGEIKDKEIILYLSGKQFSKCSEIRAGEVEYEILGKEFRGSEYKLVCGD